MPTSTFPDGLEEGVISGVGLDWSTIVVTDGVHRCVRAVDQKALGRERAAVLDVWRS